MRFRTLTVIWEDSRGFGARLGNKVVKTVLCCVVLCCVLHFALVIYQQLSAQTRRCYKSIFRMETLWLSSSHCGGRVISFPDMRVSSGLRIIILWLAGCFCEPSGSTDANLGFVFQKSTAWLRQISVCLLKPWKWDKVINQEDSLGN